MNTLEKDHNASFIKKIAQDFVIKTIGNENPEGYSFSLCFPLSILFSLLDIHHELSFGNAPKNNGTVSHFWLTFDKEGTILDPTIKQFNYPSEHVYIGKIDDNSITQQYVVNKRNFDEIFKEVYQIWADLLLQLQPRIRRSAVFENKMIAVNVKAANLLLTYVDEFGLKDKLLQSNYGKSYFYPID